MPLLLRNALPKGCKTHVSGILHNLKEIVIYQTRPPFFIAHFHYSHCFDSHIPIVAAFHNRLDLAWSSIVFLSICATIVLCWDWAGHLDDNNHSIPGVSALQSITDICKVFRN